MDLENLQKVAFSAQYSSQLTQVDTLHDQLCKTFDALIVNCFAVDAAIGHYLYKSRDFLYGWQIHFKKSLHDDEKIPTCNLHKIHKAILDLEHELHRFQEMCKTDVSEQLTMFAHPGGFDLANNYDFLQREALGSLLWTTSREVHDVRVQLGKLVELDKQEQDSTCTVDSEMQ